jgi:hypothetical protein
MAHQDTFAALRRLGDARCDQRMGVVAALQGDQAKLRMGHRRVARRRNDRVGFGELGLGDREVAGEHVPGGDRGARAEAP